ncbi:MAG: ATP-binding domain-containing protein, partial [Candidatus Eisenbacteria bacterium]|nr:ATP-binding domain-containing protein [Candidatus Eisenbacteria bacterium]
RTRSITELAVLYRTNAQSRALETELAMRGVHYEIVGGVAFYQRREVKDVLAYLRLGVNPLDAAAFWRAWNTPRRGLGDAVRSRVEERVANGAASPLEALRRLASEGALSRAATVGALAFLAIIDEVAARGADPVDQVLDRVLEVSRYIESLDGESSEVEERRANLEELRTGAAAYASHAHDAGVAAFLSETALLTDLDRVDGSGDRLLLMTAHNAKGLEFPVVIVAGLEEGLLPHASSLDDPAELEEERRLFYVALTRAQDEVLMCAAAWRRRHDGMGGGAVSRFVDEVPEDVLTREGISDPAWGHGTAPDRFDDAPSAPYRTASTGRAARTPASDPWPARTNPRSAAVGREVFHELFGRGVVMAAEGEGPEAKYTVRFGTQIKKVFGRFLTGGGDVHHAD